MNIGSLDTRITTEARGTTRDAAGQPVAAAWAPVRSLWASMLLKNGAQTIRSDQPVSVVQASFRIHWRTDVTSAMRVRVGSSEVYEIKAVLPDRKSRKHVDLVCELVAGHG